ncbi:M24 family metallopeptidase [Agrococcus carbonis]|uniref:Xaa-Pro dipeptidase n=1 Tax=Agrococcus carbonis TaxID=684552 RepID=A0A1H1P965_9MICO|nr:M24 family metallopeptidase [Agrococcus carbonis]SDS07535.1 Xaa-Pro dipeptidase [Agrococcus carbonis]
MQPSPDELAERLARTRARMTRSGLDGLVVVDPANLHYLTGYDAWSFYMPQLLFVPLEGEPLLIMRAMDAGGAHRTAVATPPERILGYPESLVHQRNVHPFDWAAEQLRAHGFARRGRVGYEGEAHFFSVRSFLALQRGLPEWQLVDGHDLVNWVRLVKSPAELELMRAAGRVASAAMRAGIDAIAEGARLNDIAAAIQFAQATGVEGAEGDYPAIVPMLPTGESADTPHMTFSARRLDAGEAVSIELAGAHRRYHAPLARTLSLGRPDARLARVAAVAAEGLQLVLDGLRPGLTVAEVHGIWQSHIAREGIEKPSRLGYSIGIGYPPDWGERTVSIRGDDQTIVEAGMCLHIIAGMWMDGYGCEISEAVAVAERGVEILTDAPRELIVLEDA